MQLKKARETYDQYLIDTEKSIATIRGYTKELNKLEGFLVEHLNCPPYLIDIDPSLLEAYMIDQKNHGLAQSSRSRSYHILKAFFGFCYKKSLHQKELSLNLEPIKVKKKERIYLTEDEVMELVGAIDMPFIKTIILFIYHTGLRISECCDLKVDDVDLKKKVIHVIDGKGGKDRDIPMSDTLYTILLDYLSVTNEQTTHFFTTHQTAQVSPRYVNFGLREALKKLDWKKKVSAHTLRHTFASRLVKNNVNIVRIQKLLGHSDLRATSIYTHTNQDELREAVNTI